MDINTSDAKLSLSNSEESISKLDNKLNNCEWNDSVHDSFLDFILDLKKTISKLTSDTNKLCEAISLANEIDVDSFKGKVDSTIGGI